MATNPRFILNARFSNAFSEAVLDPNSPLGDFLSHDFFSVMKVLRINWKSKMLKDESLAK